MRSSLLVGKASAYKTIGAAKRWLTAEARRDRLEIFLGAALVSGKPIQCYERRAAGAMPAS